jgi:hypothetical protein
LAPQDVGHVPNRSVLAGEEGSSHRRPTENCKVPLPVAEVVLDVVALVLQGVEDLVLDLPPIPGGLCDFRDVSPVMVRFVTQVLW